MPRGFALACGLGVALAYCALFAGSAAAWVLPEGRVYEMVSPPYKAGYGVIPDQTQTGAASDGERFVFTSLGVFADAKSDVFKVPYLARRDPERGWVTSAAIPPPADGRLPSDVRDFSPDLSREISGAVAATQGASEQHAALMLADLLAPEISFVQAWPLPDAAAALPGGLVGMSSDLSHVVFGEASGLRQIVGVGGPQPEVRDVAVVGEPDGPGGAVFPACADWRKLEEVNLGSPGGQYPAGGLQDEFHAISVDGSEIFFSHCGALYVRVNGSTTFELSPAGVFEGAAADGSKVFFKDSTTEVLYMAVIDREPGHEAVSETIAVTPGGAAMVCSSDDGSHVYFTLGGDLYVFDTLTRETTLIAAAGVEVGQTTPDGHFLVFTTASRLTPDDTDTAPSVYEYDAQTGGLVRVSIGENGHDANGNDNAFGASIANPMMAAENISVWKLNARAVSNDGSTVVFSTAAPLSPRAINGRVNVYVWHEGRVGMISTGLSQTSDELPVISASGRDVFFLTSQSILPQDSDGLLDVYDARVDGGFPQPPVPAGGCRGDSCQGPPSVPQLLMAPVSATFSGLGNPTPAAPTPAVKSKPKSKPKKCKKAYVKRKGRCVKKPKAKKAGNDRRIKR